MVTVTAMVSHGSSNGNGNGGNGSGNGNGGSGGNGGGNGGGGMGESIVYETLNSKDKPFVKKLVGKLRKGSKTHAKQADDLEKAMTESSNPRIPRKKGQPAKSKKHSDLYTDEDPKGTIHGLGFKDVAKAKASVSKISNSSRSHAHKIQAAVAMEQRAREMGKTSEAAVYRKYINAMKKKTKRMNEAVSAAQQAAIAIDMKKKGKKPKSVKEETMTPAQKRKDTMLKKKYDKSDMKKSMQKQYGKEEGKKVYFATIRKQAMEDVQSGMKMPPLPGLGGGGGGTDSITSKAKTKTIGNTLKDVVKIGTIPARFLLNIKSKPDPTEKFADYNMTPKQKVSSAISNYKSGMKMESAEDDKYNVSEEGLRDWFGKSSGTTKSGRKVRGWVQVGGKYDGKPCARQPGQKSTPKCVSSAKRRSMSKSERDSAARRKRAADPNQPQKSGAAKPTNVSTDPKRKMKKEEYTVKNIFANISEKKKFGPGGDPIKKQGFVDKALEKLKNTTPVKKIDTDVPTSESFVNEAKDKKGKGSGTKDACYHKVKSRYSVWPSAYASGALVKCRKVGAANWGNKTKKEGFSPMQVAALEVAGMIEINEAGKKCWKGYEKKGTQTLFGKTYNRCVKKKSTKESVEFDEGIMDTVKDVGKKVIKKTKEFINKPIIAPTINQKDYQQRVKDKTTHELVGEGTSYGIFRGSGKPSGQMSAFDKKKKDKDKDKKKAQVEESITFLKRKKKESSSEYTRERDAGKEAKKVMKKKDQEKVNFLEPEETNESKTRLIKNGHTYRVVLTWRGKTYMVQMFVPSVSRPTRQQIEKEVQKLYPDAKVMSFLPRNLEPGEPTVMMGEDVERDEYGDPVGGPKISKKEKKKNLAKNEKDEDHTTTTAEEVEVVEAKYEAGASTYGKASIRNKRRFGTKGENPDPLTGKKITKDATRGELIAKRREEHKEKRGVKEELNIVEDDMKGMSVKSGHKRPTKKGAGMTQKGVEAYRRRNPGSKLKTAVTGKVKKGSKDAKRRKSYCARSAGQMKKFPKAAKDPNSRLRQARRRWKC